MLGSYLVFCVCNTLSLIETLTNPHTSQQTTVFEIQFIRGYEFLRTRQTGLTGVKTQVF